MRASWLIAGMLACLGLAAPGPAQVRSVDPNQAIDQDLPGPRPTPAPRRGGGAAGDDDRRGAAPAGGDDRPYADADHDAAPRDPGGDDRPYGTPAAEAAAPVPSPAQERRADATRDADATFHRDDLIGAGEGVFGKGAQGFAGIIQKILKNQGEPNAYIAGREASGAVVVGLRYGSGVMTHKVEGQMPVYWTGPSVGFDLGGDANKVFVLVYNLYDTAELFHRFPQGEGRLYAIGGFSASYLRWGHVVLIPVRLGVGWRAGVNVGYMKFTRRSKWLPF